MNNKEFLDSVGDIDPDIVLESRPKNRRRLYLRVASAAAALLLVVGVLIALPRSGMNNDITAEAPSTERPAGANAGAATESPVYSGGQPLGNEAPTSGETAGYVLARPTKRTARSLTERYSAAAAEGDISEFTSKLTYELLREKSGENIAFSPVNLYMALAMLAETTAGETRSEILSVLGKSDIFSIRNEVRTFMDAETADGVNSKCLMADSLWLNRKYSFHTDTLETLADNYDASSFWGDPKDTGFVEALRSWLNENTGGLLKDSADKAELDVDTVLSILTTVYFKDQWNTPFIKEATGTDVFHGADGDTECEFMYKSAETETAVYFGNGFIAAGDRLKGGGSVWYLLPDRGVSIEDMLTGGGMDFIFGSDIKRTASWGLINWTVPKYDVSADLDLIEACKSLGMTSCFDFRLSDFTPLTSDSDTLYVSKINHSARVKVDEDGIEAAAFTQIDAVDDAAPAHVVDVTLDRPFVFVVTGLSGQPLFIGIVNSMEQ